MSPHLDDLVLAVDALLQAGQIRAFVFHSFARIRTIINRLNSSFNCRMTLVAFWLPKNMVPRPDRAFGRRIKDVALHAGSSVLTKLPHSSSDRLKV